MRKTGLGICLLMIFISVGTLNAQKQRTIKDVVLLNVEPFEVLMTENGDIINKIRHLPNYLKTDTLVIQESSKSEIAMNPEVELAKDVVSADVAAPFKKIEKRVVKAPKADVILKDYYEVGFTPSTATLSNKAIATLNELAKTLNANPEQKIQIFGFQNEAPHLASILSKRRRDACVSYLKIKGVNTREQVILGSITKGNINKIVFGFQ